MTRVQRYRLIGVVCVVAGLGVAALLASQAFREYLMYFYTPSDRLAADSGRVIASARTTDPEVSGRSTGRVTRSSVLGPVWGASTSNGDSPVWFAAWVSGAAMVAAASVPMTVAREMKRCPAGIDDVGRAGLGTDPVTSWSNDVVARVDRVRVACVRCSASRRARRVMRAGCMLVTAVDSTGPPSSCVPRPLAV